MVAAVASQITWLIMAAWLIIVTQWIRMFIKVKHSNEELDDTNERMREVEADLIELVHIQLHRLTAPETEEQREFTEQMAKKYQAKGNGHLMP